MIGNVRHNVPGVIVAPTESRCQRLLTKADRRESHDSTEVTHDYALRKCRKPSQIGSHIKSPPTGTFDDTTTAATHSHHQSGTYE